MPGKVIKTSEPFVRRAGQARQSLAAIEANLASVISSIEDVTIEALLKAGEAIKKRSNELCPKDTGQLRRSAFVEEVQDSPKGRLQVVVGYDRKNEAPHAVFVHEILEAYHKPPTQAKFLQTAGDELSKSIAKIVVDDIKSKTKLGKGK